MLRDKQEQGNRQICRTCVIYSVVDFQALIGGIRHLKSHIDTRHSFHVQVRPCHFNSGDPLIDITVVQMFVWLFVQRLNINQTIAVWNDLLHIRTILMTRYTTCWILLIRQYVIGILETELTRCAPKDQHGSRFLIRTSDVSCPTTA